jgi:hypothetical protein
VICDPNIVGIFAGTLILNGLSLPLQTLKSIVQSAPDLRELHLSKAKFPEMDKDTLKAPISTILEELHVNDCGIPDWCRVLSILRLFPGLERLENGNGESEQYKLMPFKIIH